MVTVDLLMSTSPCEDWPRARVKRLLASRTIDASSWVAFARSCAARKWRAPTLADLRLTACRYAEQHHRADVLIPWVQEATRQRVAAQRARYKSTATTETLAIWTALESWDGTAAQARDLSARASAERRRSWRAYNATAAAATAAYNAAYDAAYDAAAAAAAAYDAAADDERTLLDLCARLDAAMAAREAA